MSTTQRERGGILDEPSPAFILVSRIFLGMFALLLAVIPWSERYTTLDCFPHGRDAELSLLAFFALFGLILLFLRAAKKHLRNLLAAAYLPYSNIPPAGSLIPGCRHCPAFTDLHRPPLPGSSLDKYSPPLQI